MNMIAVKCSCGARYQVPETLAGKRAKCKRCGGAIPIPAAQVIADPAAHPGKTESKAPSVTESRLRTEDAPDDREGTGVSLFDDLPAAPGGTYSVGEAVVVEKPGPVEDEHVPLRIEPTAASGGFARFWKDAAWSFLFVADPGNLVTFLVVGALFALMPILPMGGCFGNLAMLVVLGWTSGFLFNVIAAAANGERDLPALMATEGWFDDIIAPFFKFVAAALIAFGPMVAYTVQLGASGAAPDPTILLMLMVLGAFLWPMVVLVIALGGIGSLLRVDLIAITIVRTLVPYLMTVVVTGAAAWLGTTISERVQMESAAGGRSPVALSMVLGALQLYLSVAASRVIGLYYHHFKDRFAWSWG